MDSWALLHWEYCLFWVWHVMKHINTLPCQICMALSGLTRVHSISPCLTTDYFCPSHCVTHQPWVQSRKHLWCVASCFPVTWLIYTAREWAGLMERPLMSWHLHTVKFGNSQHCYPNANLPSSPIQSVWPWMGLLALDCIPGHIWCNWFLQQLCFSHGGMIIESRHYLAWKEH